MSSARVRRESRQNISRNVVFWGCSLDFLMQPRPSVGPQTIGSSRGNPEKFRYLRQWQSGKEAKLNHVRRGLVFCGQFDQGFIQREQIFEALRNGDFQAV